MAKNVGSAVIFLNADISGWNKGLGQAEAGMKRTMGNILNVAQRAGQAMAIAGAAIEGLSIGLFKLASDAQESENLFEVSMGKHAKAARGWSDELAKSLGLNSYELRKQVGTWYQITKNMGVAEDQAFEMSKALTKLAGDMASFYNMSTDEAFQKLQSGITGEIEPLRRLGIVVSMAAMEEEAHRQGIKKKMADMTEAEKVMLRYSIITRSTAAAQGDLERTANSAANVLRRMRERGKELGQELGSGLIGVFEKLAIPLVGLIDKALEWVKANEKLSAKLVLIGAAAGAFLLVVGGLLMALPTLASAFVLLAPVIAGLAVPIGLVIAALALLWANWDSVWGWMQDKIHQAFEYINQTFYDGKAGAGSTWGELMLIIEEGWIQAKALLEKGMNWLWAKFGPAISAVLDYFAGKWPLIKQVAKDAWDAIKAGFDAFIEVWNAAWPTVSKILGEVWDDIAGIIKAGWEVIKGIFDAFLLFMKGDWPQAWDALKDGMKNAWDVIKKTFADDIAYLKNMLSNFATWLVDKISVTPILGKAFDAFDKGSANLANWAFGVEGYAAGTPSSRSGLAVVGERGPELVRLPGGSRVYSNSESRGMAGTQFNAPLMNITIEGGSGADIADQMERNVLPKLQRMVLDVTRRGINYGNLEPA